LFEENQGERMKYSIKNVNSDNLIETMGLISEVNGFAHANKRNSSHKYKHEKVIKFLSSDSDKCDEIIESIMPINLLP
jgi:hypothetical protein